MRLPGEAEFEDRERAGQAKGALSHEGDGTVSSLSLQVQQGRGVDSSGRRAD